MGEDHLSNPAAGLRAETICREVHEHADEIAVEMHPGEDAHRALLSTRHDQLREPQQICGRCLEQFVPWQCS
jgi:hypothetical protein